MKAWPGSRIAADSPLNPYSCTANPRCFFDLDQKGIFKVEVGCRIIHNLQTA